MISSRKKILQGVSQVETITLIVVCILLYTQPSNLVYFSNTILGKLLLVTSLVLASIHSTFSGFCIALLIIIFSYQTYEGLESGTGVVKSSDNTNEVSTETANKALKVTETDSGDVKGAGESILKGVNKSTLNGTNTSTDVPKGTSAVTKTDGVDKKNADKDKSLDTGVITNNKFKKMYCKDNKLRNKNGELVEQKDISSVFKTIKFNNGECNPCDETCSFTITDTHERMNTEENLRPVDSNSLPIVK